MCGGIIYCFIQEYKNGINRFFLLFNLNFLEAQRLKQIDDNSHHWKLNKTVLITFPLP